MTSYIGSAMKLRYVVRETQHPVDDAPQFTYTRVDRVLQYGLRPVSSNAFEWFDVPTVDLAETQRSSSGEQAK